MNVGVIIRSFCPITRKYYEERIMPNAMERDKAGDRGLAPHARREQPGADVDQRQFAPPVFTGGEASTLAEREAAWMVTDRLVRKPRKAVSTGYTLERGAVQYGPGAGPGLPPVCL
jgi:hypothetical protein